MELKKAIPNDVVYYRQLKEDEVIVTPSGPVAGMAGGYEVHHTDDLGQPHLVSYMEEAEFELLYSPEQTTKQTTKKTASPSRQTRKAS